MTAGSYKYQMATQPVDMTLESLVANTNEGRQLQASIDHPACDSLKPVEAIIHIGFKGITSQQYQGRLKCTKCLPQHSVWLLSNTNVYFLTKE